MAGSTPQRRDDIQGLRAVAVLVVVAFHATDLVPGGFVGVDIFFVISGYVITMMLARERAKRGAIDLRRFYVRRFKRLTPALALVTTVTMIAATIFLSPLGAQQTVADTALGSMLLVANVVIARNTGGYFDDAADHNPLLHTWSLSVEEQFYLIFPLMLTVCWSLAQRGAGRRWFPITAVVTVGAISLALASIQSASVPLGWLPDVLSGYYGPVTRVWEFAVGAAIALAGGRLSPASVRSATVTAAVGLAGVLGSLWLITPETPFPGPWALLPVAATGLLLVAGEEANPIGKLLGRAPMIRLGDLSYSLYLWHWPFIVFGTLLWPGSVVAPVVAAVMSVGPAWASYTFLEQPVRMLRVNRVGFSVLVAVTLLAPLLLSRAVIFATANDYWNDTVRGYSEAIKAPHISSLAPAGCSSRAWEKTADCTWNREAAGRPIYLVGDSNAVHFSDALVEAGISLDRPIVVSAQIGCAFVDVRLKSSKPWVEERCNSYVDNTTASLMNAPPGTVVIANSYLWWHPSSDVMVGITGNDASQESGEKLDKLSRGLRASVAVMQRAGHQVVLVQPIPYWGDSATSMTWGACSVLRMVNGTCTQSFSVDEAATRQAGIWNVVATAAQETGADLMSLATEICPGEICKSESPDGLVRYQDATHITVPQSKQLAPVFKSTLEGSYPPKVGG